MYKAQLTHKSSQAVFLVNMVNLCDKPEPVANGICVEISILNCVDFYWNVWISVAKIHRTMVDVAAPLSQSKFWVIMIFNNCLFLFI